MIEPPEAAALAVKRGLCGEISVLGFVCTRGHDHPRDEHQAKIVGGPNDGFLCDRWPTAPPA